MWGEEPFDINMICPGHGPILRTNWKKYVETSKQYAEEAMKRPTIPQVFIPYVSAYHKTGLIAEKIAEGIKLSGEIDVEVLDVEHACLGEVDEKIGRSSGVIVGSPTINQNILLPIYKLFAVINPLRDKGKLAAAFGSYGWSGENRDMIETNLRNLKLNIFDEGIFVKFTPDAEDEQKCIDYGKAFGEELLKSGD